MQILLLAPHPFYQERGTPIAVDLLVRTLVDLGHHVDLLTYHEGEDRDYGERVRLHRIAAPPLCRNIRPGFSRKKIFSDVFLYRAAARLMRTRRYEVIHAVEEAAFIARHLGARHRVPYIFDMDSSMPVQIADALPVARPLLPAMRAFERLAVRDALAVTAVCEALAVIARAAGARRVFLLHDVPLLDHSRAGCGYREALGRDGLDVLYIGNLEAYQGIELLQRSFARLPDPGAARLILVGGIPRHIEHYRALAAQLGIGDRVHLLGPRPLSDMNALMQDADLLVSPRTKGQNTPMKIYSYMASGRPILATDLSTHTQVLTPDTAALAAPEPSAFAEAMAALLADPARRDALGHAARERVENTYALPVFQRTVAELYAYVQECAS